MGAELATLTSLKNDIKVFGPGAKEFTAVAGEDLSKGTQVSMGTDSSVYKTPNGSDKVGSYTVTSESYESEKGNGSLEQEHDKVVMQNGAVEVLFSHIDNRNTNSNYVGTQKLVLSTISDTGTKNINVVQQETYYPTSRNYRSFGRHEIHKLNETHFAIIYHYRSNGYNSGVKNCYIYTKMKVYSVSATGKISNSISEASFAHDNNTSWNWTGSWGYSYGVILRLDNYTFISGNYASGTYGQKFTINSSDYTISNTNYTFGNTRSSNHYGFNMYFDDGAGNTSAMWYINSSTSNAKWLINSAGTWTESTPDSTEQAFMSSGSGSYGVYTSFVINNTAFAFCDNPNNRKAMEYSADGTYTQYPITFDTEDEMYTLAVKYDNQSNISYVQESDTSWLVALPSRNPSLYMGKSGTDYSNTVTQYNVIIVRLEKDTTNGVYIGSSVCVVEKAINNYDSLLGLIMSNGKLFLSAQNIYNYDDSNNVQNLNSALYELSIYNPSRVPASSVAAYVKDDVASGENVTLVTSGTYADFDIPVGLNINGWVGIGNSKSIKGGI